MGDHSVVCFRPFDLLFVHRLCLFFSQGLSVLSENRVFHLGGGAWVDSEDTCRLEFFGVCVFSAFDFDTGVVPQPYQSADGLSLL